MSGIEYDDRRLRGRCGYCIRCILRIAPCCELHPCRADSEDPEEQRASCHDLSDFRFHIYITSEVVLVKVYVRGQGNMTILEPGEYQATVPDKQCKGGAAAPTGKGSGIEAYPAAESNHVKLDSDRSGEMVPADRAEDA